MTILSGKELATDIRLELAKQIAKQQINPGLAVIQVGEDPASSIYVRNKMRAATEIGITPIPYHLPETTVLQDLLSLLNELNQRSDVHGILVQLPLPDHIDSKLVIDAILPIKDVDGFHSINVGKLHQGYPGMIPCTPLGCMHLLEKTGISLPGKNAVVIGRSNIVGKPIAALLSQANCTVTLAHSHTTNLPEICRNADILVVAIGKANYIQANWIKPGAIVLDVGMNRHIDDQGHSHLCGDVDFHASQNIASYITPVPGGVGPMTIACLLQNTVTACQNQQQQNQQQQNQQHQQ